MQFTDKDREYIRQAIEASQRCRPEGGKPTPKVGAVVVKDGKVLAVTWRGQEDAGDHAEFVALEKKLKNVTLAGATLYTTLEPCTTRGHPKVPCADRLIERKIARVVIGMLDPNPSIGSKGVRKLRDHNVRTDLFPDDLAAEVEDLNRYFTRQIQTKVALQEISDDFIDRYSSRNIDEWHKAVNYIYADRNFYRDASSIFSHLVEVLGGLSRLASKKKKPGPQPESFLPKALAWWFTLCGKLGVASVAELLWLKFPGVCPYCQLEDHDQTICDRKKLDSPTPKWNELRAMGRRKKRPSSLGEWQRMFRRIYKPSLRPDFESTFARLAEEIGELAEAVRIFRVTPGYFLNEAADVFAWLMNIQNNIDFRNGRPEEEYGHLLEESFCRAYPDYCIDCKQQRCICRPILRTTIGRIAHELPMDSEFLVGLTFVGSDNVETIFRPPS